MMVTQTDPRNSDRELGLRAERTKALVVETARTMFLEKGYGGTRIDDIADVAGISRGTFYTYFPSKREVLLATGDESANEATKIVAALSEIPDDWETADLMNWVRRWWEFLDVHGAFVLVWGQAAYNDEQMRTSGVRTQVRIAKKVGAAFVRLGHPQPIHAAADALALVGMMERLWYYAYVAKGMIDHEEAIESITRIMAATISSAS